MVGTARLPRSHWSAPPSFRAPVGRRPHCGRSTYPVSLYGSPRTLCHSRRTDPAPLSIPFRGRQPIGERSGRGFREAAANGKKGRGPEAVAREGVSGALRGAPWGRGVLGGSGVFRAIGGGNSGGPGAVGSTVGRLGGAVSRYLRPLGDPWGSLWELKGAVGSAWGATGGSWGGP